VGYKHYPDDLVCAFVQRSADYGMDVFRIFDALNDTRNMRVAIQAVLDAGKIAEGAISYTVSPFHTVERFVDFSQELVALGCQQICIKDMAGLLAPQVAFSLVSALKQNLDVPIHIHSHSTSGMAEAAYLKAIEAGADIIDTAISPFAGGTSQPPTESLAAMLQHSPHPSRLALEGLTPIADYFKTVRARYAHFESRYTGVDPRVLRFQIPGGMISNLANQLRDQGALDRMEEVLAEVPHVRKDMGYPPLVTPTSQIVGTQAVLNVLLGERYQTLSLETRNLLLGKYGKTPAPCNPQLIERAQQQSQQQPITQRPADLLEPILEQAQQQTEEFQFEQHNPNDDPLSYALFPQVAKQFFEERDRGGPPPQTVAAALTAVLMHLRQDLEPQPERATYTKQAWKWAGRVENMT
ncbi:MAG: pyruvate carboxylase subunit B, partial [Myxococcota bacterium]